MKSIVKSVRLSKEQLEQINGKLGDMTFSEFALLAMLNETPKKEKRLRENRALIIELAKWGNNLNQVAKHLNAEREVDSTEQKALARKRGLDDKIREFVKQLRELENTIRQAVERISKKIRARLRDRELKNEVLGGRGLGL